jgi:hypothetical protein
MLGGEYCDIKARSDQKVPPKKLFSFRWMTKTGSAYRRRQKNNRRASAALLNVS